MKRIFFWMTLGVVALLASCKSEPVTVTVVATSDLETSLLSHDYKYMGDSRGGAALVADYLTELKSQCGEESVIYVDNGDLLPGWPLNYYMKNIETTDTTLAAYALNALGCEVYSLGEGDLAQGKALVERHVKTMKGAPVCANLLDAKSGAPIYKPYAVVERNGMKIAFLGLITEAAPKYMNATCMEGMKIEDAQAAAAKWIAEIKSKEAPDAIVGLFHMGASAVSKRTKSREDMAVTIVRNVDGFDAVVCGHDGLRRSRTIDAANGKKVVLASPGRRGMYVVSIAISAERAGEGFKNKMVDVSIKPMIARSYDKEYSAAIRPVLTELRKAMSSPIATLKANVGAVDALFGSSAYIDFVHKVQMENTGADLSLVHPYNVKEGFGAGNLLLTDVNRFYPGRGKLYTVKLKGSEIRDMLMTSIIRFYRTVKSKEDILLKYDDNKTKLSESTRTLESVGGLRYVVYADKMKKEERVKILGLANGRPFDLNKEYTVAVGEDYVMNANIPLNIGAKVKPEDMQSRVVAVSEKDMAELVCEYIKEKKTLDLKPAGNWSLLPAAWMKNIKENEMKLLTRIYFPYADAFANEGE